MQPCAVGDFENEIVNLKKIISMENENLNNRETANSRKGDVVERGTYDITCTSCDEETGYHYDPEQDAGMRCYYCGEVLVINSSTCKK